MTVTSRVGLAIALAWAGGFGSVDASGPWRLIIATLVLVLAARAGKNDPSPASPEVGARGSGRALALALLLGLLAHTLARVVIAVPAALWSLPFVALAPRLSLGLGRSAGGGRGRAAALALLIGVALLAGVAGSRFEMAGDQARGAVRSGPILGVHPRQAVAVRIDGFGPHDVIVDDYVDLPGGLGYDAEGWAARLEIEVRAIAAAHYAEGPARAQIAFAQAEVRVVGSHGPRQRVELLSGTTGDGSKVEFVCPGQTRDPRHESSTGTNRECPHKYLVDGSTGLGLSPRWPGYVERHGQDRARLGRVGARLDIEIGLWVFVLTLGAWVMARRRRAHDAERAAAALAVLALAGITLLAVACPLAEAGSSHHGGPTLLAIGLAAFGSSAAPSTNERGERICALTCAAALALLSASPLAGRGDALALLEAICAQLVLGLGLAWETSRALAASLSVVTIAAGVGICARALLGGPPATRSEGRHAQALAPIGLALAVGVSLALRKPGDELALLCGATAVLIVATATQRGRALRLGLALACALGAALVLLPEPARTPLALASTISGAILCLSLGLRRSG